MNTKTLSNPGMFSFKLYIGQHTTRNNAVIVHTDVNVREAVEYAMAGVDLAGATFTGGTGVYKGAREPSVTVEFIGPADIADQVRAVAESVKNDLDQESVLFTVQPLNLAEGL